MALTKLLLHGVTRIILSNVVIYNNNTKKKTVTARC